MARYWTLAAILVVCGCSDKTPTPAPEAPSLRVQIQRGRYVLLVRCDSRSWEIISDELPTSEPCLTLICANERRFSFSESAGMLHIHRRGTGATDFAQLPVTLKAGSTWDSVVQNGQERRAQKASCSQDGDRFRVDFSEDGKILHSMWFSPPDGLVRWTSVDRGTLERRTYPPNIAPEPSTMRIVLRPASFEQFGWTLHRWQLAAGGNALGTWEDLVDTDMPQPEEKVARNWHTVSCDGSLRYSLCERGGYLRLYHRVPLDDFARIPLVLSEGLTWNSTIVDDKGPRIQKATCSREGDLFRVAFTEDGKILHSIWFSPVDGLARWEGIAGAPIKRVGSPLKHAARTYASWGRVDDEVRLAPGLCRAPIEPPLRTSTSRDETTHGRKQYYLFARNREAYLHARDVDQPEGQIVIKESFYQKTKGPLFMMMKSGGEWTYATASPDGKEITAQGKLPSCMECHESDRTRDRMFGLQSCASAK